MARPLRVELADGYYHVMNRGNNRQDIFLSDKEKKGDGVDLLRKFGFWVN